MNTLQLKGSEQIDLQNWFAKAIGQPLPEKYRENPLEVSDPQIDTEANAIINSKGGLSGFARLGVYNQQYWFRLISIMQSEYPCAVHIMGLKKFNKWVESYLLKYPPTSPYLACLDEYFLDYSKKELKGKNRKEILQAISYDRALSKVFDAQEGNTLSNAGVVDINRVLQLKLQLAPHVSVLKLDFDFQNFRESCLADESLEAEIALARLPSCLVIFRDNTMNIRQVAIANAAELILSGLKTPTLLPEVFAKLEPEFTAKDLELVQKNLANWISEWVVYGLICVAENKL